jgi:site-specific DNA-methyltransferase (adenine-specific)
MACNRTIGPFDCCSVVQGDCLELMKQLPDGCVDAVITDPPYSDHVHAKHWVGASAHEDGFRASYCRNKDIGFDAITSETMQSVSRELARLLVRWALMFCNVELSSEWRAHVQAAGLEYVRTGAWVKLDAAPQFTGDRPAPGYECIVIAHPVGRKKWNGGGRQGVWTYPIVMDRGGKTPRLHTTQKPEAMMLELVGLFSDVSELVLDPFMGSGTTLVAAKKLCRHFLGFEISPEYCEIARKRLAEIDAQPTLFQSKPVQEGLFCKPCNLELKNITLSIHMSAGHEADIRKK